MTLFPSNAAVAAAATDASAAAAVPPQNGRDVPVVYRLSTQPRLVPSNAAAIAVTVAVVTVATFEAAAAAVGAKIGDMTTLAPAAAASSGHMSIPASATDKGSIARCSQSFSQPASFT